MAMRSRVYISYSISSQRDSGLARSLIRVLGSFGVAVWRTPLSGVSMWNAQVTSALIQKSSHFVVIVSRASVHDPSVLGEVDLARECHRRESDFRALALMLESVSAYPGQDFLGDPWLLDANGNIDAQLSEVAKAVGLWGDTGTRLAHDKHDEWEPNPSYSTFEEALRYVQQYLSRVPSSEQRDELQNRFDLIIDHAIRAYQDQDSTAWLECNEQLHELVESATPLYSAHESSLPAPTELLAYMSQKLVELEARARKAHSRAESEEDEEVEWYERFKRELNRAHFDLNAIDPTASNAQTQILSCYRNNFVVLEDALKGRELSSSREHHANAAVEPILTTDGVFAAIDDPAELLSAFEGLPPAAIQDSEIRHVMATCHSKIGMQSANRKDFRKAIQQFESALSLDPSDVPARKMLGQVLIAAGVQAANDGNFKVALEHLRHASDLDPNEKVTRRNLAYCLAAAGIQAANQGDLALAQDNLSEAYQLEPNDSSIRENYYLLCDVHVKRRKQEAGRNPDVSQGWFARFIYHILRREHAPRFGAAKRPVAHVERTAEFPGSIVDPVHFAVTGHRLLRPGTSAVMSVWAYLEPQRKEIEVRAREALGGLEPPSSRWALPRSQGARISQCS